MYIFSLVKLLVIIIYCKYTWAPFLETPNNVPSLKTIKLGAQYSAIVLQFVLILKAKF